MQDAGSRCERADEVEQRRTSVVAVETLDIAAASARPLLPVWDRNARPPFFFPKINFFLSEVFSFALYIIATLVCEACLGYFFGTIFPHCENGGRWLGSDNAPSWQRRGRVRVQGWFGVRG